jgi:hypothetical protein
MRASQAARASATTGSGILNGSDEDDEFAELRAAWDVMMKEAFSPARDAEAKALVAKYEAEQLASAREKSRARSARYRARKRAIKRLSVRG